MARMSSQIEFLAKCQLIAQIDEYIYMRGKNTGCKISDLTMYIKPISAIQMPNDRAFKRKDINYVQKSDIN